MSAYRDVPCPLTLAHPPGVRVEPFGSVQDCHRTSVVRAEGHCADPAGPRAHDVVEGRSSRPRERAVVTPPQRHHRRLLPAYGVHRTTDPNTTVQQKSAPAMVWGKKFLQMQPAVFSRRAKVPCVRL